MAARAAIAGSSSDRGRRERVLAHAGGEQLGGGRVDDLRGAVGVEHDPLKLVQVRQRQEHVSVGEHEIGQVEGRLARGAACEERQRDAVPAVVGDDRAAGDPEHLADVVPDQLRVAREGVALTLRLVGEPEAREVEDADASVPAERLDDVVPVDAARRKAVQEKQRRRFRVAELGVKDPQLARVPQRLAGRPVEEAPCVQPFPSAAIHPFPPTL